MFCRIYISKEDIDRKELLKSISEVMRAKLDGAYIEKSGYLVSVTLNDECDEIEAKRYPDGFLFFPASVEIDIQDDVSVENAAEEVSKVLTFLWMNNCSAVASCDFEDLLPEHGGYKSRNIPWPQ
jgi:hypothetical protein